MTFRERRVRQALAVAMWLGFAFGVVEGAIGLMTRLNPRLFAAHKVSPDVLWIAPLVNALVFMGVTFVIGAVAALAGQRFRDRVLELQSSVLLFLGFAALCYSVGVLHVVACVLLGAGLATISHRALARRSGRLGERLHATWPLVPAVILATAAATAAVRTANEAAAAGALPVPQRRTNVLVLVLDTVRADEFRRLLKSSALPAFGQLARDGTTYDNAWATSSWSLPSHASILTGLYPHQHGADWPDLELGETAPTLAETLAKEGYVTGAFSGNKAWVTPEYLGRGFLRFRTYAAEDLIRRTAYGRVLDKIAWTANMSDAGRGRTAGDLHDDLLRFIDDYRGRPFFAYVCYMDVNQATYREMFDRYFWRDGTRSESLAAYRRSLPEVDREVGLLMQQLTERGVLDETIVIVASDHGESFGAAIAGDHEPAGHGTSLYPEQIRVPLIVRFPPAVARGLVVASNVSTTQIVPSVTALLELEPGGPGHPLPLADGAPGGDPSPRILSTLKYLGRDVRALVRDRWFYLQVRDKTPVDEALFDLSLDAGARVELGPADPLLVSLRGELESLLAPTGRPKQ